MSGMPGVRRYHGPLAVGAGIAVVLAGAWALLAGHGAAFLAAVRGVSWWTLVLAVGLHLVAVVARSEAWHVSVRAAGSTLGRRCCYQVASLGFAANVVAPSFGTALTALLVASALSLFDYRYSLSAVILLPAAAALAVSALLRAGPSARFGPAR